MTMITPNEMMAAALHHMLDGREPVNEAEQEQLVQFVAVNVAPTSAEACCLLIAVIFPEYFGLLDEDAIRLAVAHQVNGEPPVRYLTGGAS